MDDGMRREAGNSSGGSSGVQVPPPRPAAPPLPVAATAEDEPLAYNPFFSRLPGDFHDQQRTAAGEEEAEEAGVDLCGPVVRRSML
jgi:hypothetical protein